MEEASRHELWTVFRTVEVWRKWLPPETAPLTGVPPDPSAATLWLALPSGSLGTGRL